MLIACYEISFEIITLLIIMYIIIYKYDKWPMDTITEDYNEFLKN